MGYLRFENNSINLEPELIIESSRLIRLKSHFINNSGDWGFFNAGTGSSAVVANAANTSSGLIVGRSINLSGTTTTGQTRIGVPTGSTFTQILLGKHAWLFECYSQLLVLNNSSDQYIWLFGFVNGSSSLTDGVFFRYTITSAMFECQCINNGVLTVVSSDITVLTNTWYKFTIYIDKLATFAKFYINDILVATITTNIPKTVGDEVTPAQNLFNTLGTVSGRGFHCDYQECVGVY
jgi:hypothetical protein